MAIDKGIHIAYSGKQSGIVEMRSLNFPKRVQFHINHVQKIKQNDWADYLRGVALLLGKRHTLSVGICGVIEGGLPIGGLSSSSAVAIAFLNALCDVNGIKLPPHEIISLALEAENTYVGVSCGKLDQSCEVYSKKDHLLHLDTKDDSFELIPQNAAMPPYDIAIFFSGLERSLAGTSYNMRVDECKSAAYALMAYADIEYGKYNEAHLRNVPRPVFETHSDKLPGKWRKRAEHFYTEQERVALGAEAWRTGDLEAFGRLMYASGRSSIANYETGGAELSELYEILCKTEGIYGARFSGAGFRGCCMAFTNPQYRQSITDHVTHKYAERFPELADKFGIYFCHSVDGVGGLQP
jgi:galactokinase/galacturonokinase